MLELVLHKICFFEENKAFTFLNQFKLYTMKDQNQTKKAWNAPDVIELDLDQTAGSGIPLPLLEVTIINIGLTGSGS